MISLFLNTASSYLSCALIKDDTLCDSLTLKLDKDLSKMALINIKNLIENNGYTPKDIDSIYCVTGPGSFTGLRVGVTIAKTFCYFLDKKLYAVSSLYTLAASTKNHDYIIPVIDARRGYVFAGIYDKNLNVIMDDTYISLEELKEKVSSLTNYAYVSYEKVKNLTTTFPSLDYLNIVKNYKLNSVSSLTVVPNYLKKTEAEEHLND